MWDDPESVTGRFETIICNYALHEFLHIYFVQVQIYLYSTFKIIIVLNRLKNKMHKIHKKAYKARQTTKHFLFSKYPIARSALWHKLNSIRGKKTWKLLNRNPCSLITFGRIFERELQRLYLQYSRVPSLFDSF